MKNLVRLLTFLGLVTTILYCFPNPLEVQADESVIDEENTTNMEDGWGQHVYFSEHGQTFIPDFNRITRVDAYLLNTTAGSGISLSIKKESSQEVILGPISQRMDGGNYWETFSFSELSVESGESYGIYLSISTKNTAWWCVSHEDAYSKGNSIKYAVPDLDDDFIFKIWGYTYTEQQESPPQDSSDQNNQDTSQTSSDEQQDTSQQTGTPEVIVTGPTADEKEEAPVDEDFSPPVLTGVKKNDEETEISAEDTLEVSSDDTLEVFGTSLPDTIIVVFIDDTTFYSVADNEGNWAVTIDATKIKAGTHTVKAQAQKDGEGSAIVDFFELRKITAETEQRFQTSSPPLEEKTLLEMFLTDYIWALILFGTILLILIATLTYYFFEKQREKSNDKMLEHKGDEKEQNQEPKKEESPKKEEPKVPTRKELLEKFRKIRDADGKTKTEEKTKTLGVKEEETTIPKETPEAPEAKENQAEESQKPEGITQTAQEQRKPKKSEQEKLEGETPTKTQKETKA